LAHIIDRVVATTQRLVTMDHVSNKKMTSIPLHRVAVVRPFTQFLEDIGASVERGCRLAGLPFHALESVDNFVPSHRFWSFLVNMSYAAI